MFKGVTSEHAVNGYKPTIQFVAQPGGKSHERRLRDARLLRLRQFAVGVDPFAESPWKLPKLTVPQTGRSPPRSREVAGARLREQSVTFTGTSTSASKMTGKITFSQDQSGATCGPKTVKFAVSTNPARASA